MGNQLIKFFKWTLEFGLNNQKTTNALLWVRFPKLGQHYWDYKLSMTLGKGLGTPVGVYQRIISREYGYFANMLVDIDLSKLVSVGIIVKEEERKEFFQPVETPKLPSYCNICKTLEHEITQCQGLIKAIQNPTDHDKGDGYRQDGFQVVRNQREPPRETSAVRQENENDNDVIQIGKEVNNIGETSQRPKSPAVAVLETVHTRARESRIENISADSLSGYNRARMLGITLEELVGKVSITHIVKTIVPRQVLETHIGILADIEDEEQDAGGTKDEGQRLQLFRNRGEETARVKVRIGNPSLIPVLVAPIRKGISVGNKKVSGSSTKFVRGGYKTETKSISPILTCKAPKFRDY